ncbi:caspase-3-like [Patiria miniata]|uniref:Uncharacterized protein n=1 Tax=Patiria miniata TaxID=46514 RepID=A0A913Z2Z2_PATMI|nr:caspase-3-like [Patiria miniata]
MYILYPCGITGSSSGRSTSTPIGFAPGSASASSTEEVMIQADRSFITLGTCEGNTFNYGSSSGRSTSTPIGFAPGSASASSTGGRIIQADRSVITLGKSKGNTFNYGKEGQQSLPEYRMDRDPRGLCMIINNVKFEGSTEDRIGSDRDAVKLAGLFQKLHFEVDMEKNLTASAMLDLFKRVSQLDHTDYDCFACCILTHGALGLVSGTDNETLTIQEILELFKGNSCPSLNTKPKMFFIQVCCVSVILSPACRGDAEQEGVEVVDLQEIDDDETNSTILHFGETEEEEEEEPRGVGAGIPKTFPIEADFLLSYATVPGYVSYRGKKGSLYVNALVDQITKHHDTTDMLHILTAVNKSLCNMDVLSKKGIKKQVGAPSYTLKKVLNLRSLE